MNCMYKYLTYLSVGFCAATVQAEPPTTDGLANASTASARIKLATDKASTDLQRIVTPTTSGLSGAGTALENFLPDFQIASLLTNDGEAQPITMDFGYFLFGAPKNGGENASKLKVILNRSTELSEDLKTFFGDDFAANFDAEVGDTDDIEVQFAYNFVTENLGREVGPANPVLTKIHKDLLMDVNYADLQRAEFSARKALATLFAQLPATPKRGDLLSMVEISSGQKINCNALSELFDEHLKHISSATAVTTETKQRTTVAQHCNVIHEKYWQRQARMNTMVNLFTGERIAQLASNQPQFYVTGSYHHRDELVGAEELSLKLTYELPSGTNFNSLKRRGDFGMNYVNEIERQLVNSPFVRFNDSRFKFELEYSDVDDQTSH